MPTQIVVDQELCKGCLICLEYCPQEVLMKSSTPGLKGIFVPIPEKIDNCTVCRRCELYCPDFAIVVVKLEDD